MTEILHRSSSLADVDVKQRIIDVIAVPWNEVANVFWRGDFWEEVFHRGAFDGVEARNGKIRANREHQKGNTVGKIVESDPASELGLVTSVKIVNSPSGDEILALAEDDMVSVSIGYRTNKPSDVKIDKQRKRRDVMAAFLDHLGFVEDPAYTGAQVLAVREGHSGLAVADGPLPATPALDAILNDEIFGWAASYQPLTPKE